MKTTAITIEPEVLSKLVVHLRRDIHSRPQPDDPGPHPWDPVGAEIRQFVGDVRRLQSLVRAIQPENERSRSNATLTYIGDVIDDWCPVGRPIPIPLPRAIELVMRGALLQEAITDMKNSELKGQFQAGINKLLTTGFDGIAKQG